MSQCNYCCLRAIKQRAKARGMQVTVKSDDFDMGGLSAYAHPPDQEPDTSENSTDRLAWFMELPEQCQC